MRRALIGGPAAIVSQLQANGGYSDILGWNRLADYGRRRFDEIVLLSAGSHCPQPPKRRGADETDHPSTLIDTLKLFQAKRVTLISTMDVYPNPSLPLDEDVAIDGWPNSAFGRRQLALEQWILRHFASAFIVRIPMLYGPGVESSTLNALMQPQHANPVNPVAIHQWYPLLRLQRDLVIARHRWLPVVNLATEPLSTSRIISRLFPRATVAAPSTPAPYSRLVTKHAHHFGGAGSYILRAEEVLNDMDIFLKTSAICKRRLQIAG